MHNTEWDSLTTLAQKAAFEIDPIYNQPTIERYKNFLNMMYNYTLGSFDELKYAAELFLEDDLKKLFNEMAQEEAYHYRLAERDLNKLGAVVDKQTPVSVAKFRDYWYSIKQDERFQFLGALYLFENVAKYLEEKTHQCLIDMALEVDQAQFIKVHLEADEDHGALAAEYARQYFDQHAIDLVIGAEKAKQYWVNIHLAILN